jgi:hemerythrin-like domain-containing protein
VPFFDLAHGLLLPWAMDLLSSLSAEHRLIVEVMDAFEAFAARMGDASSVDDRELLRFMVFFSDFVDGWHHAREEEILFPAMARHGYSANSGVFAHIREQHRREHALLIALRHAAAEKAPWSEEQLRSFLDLSREVLSFERAHIRKETDLLYPDAAKELAQEPASFFDAAAIRFSETHMSAAGAHWLQRLGSELVATHASV